MPFNTFGSGAVSPSDVSYRAVALSANVTLVWPTLSQTSTDVVARIMNVTPSAGSLAITMPDATGAGVGMDVLFRNLGSYTYTIKDSSGATIGTVAASESKYLYLTSNSTSAGSWSIITFGTGTSSADASTLAGMGLKAISTTLNQKHDVSPLTANITISSSDRAKAYVWTSGSYTCTLPTAASVGSDFFFIAKNGGSGTITFARSGSDTIDGATSASHAPGEGAIFYSDGVSSWYTVGQGRSVSFAFTQLVKSVAGSSNVTLTSAECANKVIQFTGALTGNINVYVTNTVSVYYVYNNTSGAYTLTVKTVAGAGIAVTQGSHDVLVCDATNVYRAVDNTAATTLFSVGSESAPSVTFIGFSQDGIYHPSSGVVGITALGTDVIKATAVASAVNEFTLTNSATGNAITLSATGGDTNVSIAYVTKGSGTHNFTGTISQPTVLNPAFTSQTLADGATINWDASSGSIATVTTAGNRTFAAPTNLKVGGRYVLTITQDGTGGRVPTFNAVFKCSNGQAFPSPSMAAGASTVYDLVSPDGTNLYLNTQSVPTGMLMDFAGGSTPAGFLQCDGSAVSRTTYAALFAAISTTWGVGDGSTTFNIPDFRRRTSVGSGGSGTGTLGASVGNTGGAETHTLITGELASHSHGVSDPSHAHSVYDPGHSHGLSGGNDAANAGGWVTVTATSPIWGASGVDSAGTGIGIYGAYTGISINNAGSGTAHNNMQPSAVVLKVIKT